MNPTPVTLILWLDLSITTAGPGDTFILFKKPGNNDLDYRIFFNDNCTEMHIEVTWMGLGS